MADIQDGKLHEVFWKGIEAAKVVPGQVECPEAEEAEQPLPAEVDYVIPAHVQNLQLSKTPGGRFALASCVFIVYSVECYKEKGAQVLVSLH